MSPRRLTSSARTIIITGGNNGMGPAIAAAFYRHGDQILLASRHDTGVAKRLGPRARFQKCDVRQRDDHRRMVKAALRWTGRVDVLINCAGTSGWRPLADVDDIFWDAMITTNLKGTFLGCQAAAPHIKSGGSIINISSLAGKRGSAHNSVYCASKFGVNGITQALAKELGGRGIRVNAVCPVYVTTPGLVAALEDPRSPAAGQPVEPFIEEFARANAALRRMPTADEVAAVCLFLASEQASAVTGQCLNVDCGVLPQ